MGRGLFEKKFCKTCGVPFTNSSRTMTDEELAAMDEGSRGWYNKGLTFTPINLRILHDFDVKTLKTEKLDGFNNIKPLYENP